LIFSYLKVARGDRDRDVAVLQLLFMLPHVFQIDHEALAAIAISDKTLLNAIPELRNPTIYGRFVAFLGELFPEKRQAALSSKDITRGREALRQLAKRQDSWNFNPDQLR